MQVDRALVEHIALLSRLDLEEAELQRLEKDLGRIIEYVHSLDQVSTDGVEPASFFGAARNILRDDRPGESLSVEQALANAPARTTDGFRVPPVLGG